MTRYKLLTAVLIHTSLNSWCNIKTVTCGNAPSVRVVPRCWLLTTGCIKNRGLHVCTINSTVTRADVTQKKLHKHQSTWQRDSTKKRVWFIYLRDFYQRIVHIATFLLRKIFYKDEIREKQKLQVLISGNIYNVLLLLLLYNGKSTLNICHLFETKH